MTKVKRNQPCPCGSGKKYKKCCGAFNSTKIDPELINNELDHLHQEVTSFAINKYEHKINEKTTRYDKAFLKDNDQIADVYYTGLTIWALNLPFLENNQTLLELIYRNNTSKLTQQTRDVFAKWLHTVPSVYEVTSINDTTKHFITVKEVGSDQSFSIPFHKGDHFIEGSLIIGTLVPFMNYHNFLYSMIKLYSHDIDEIRQLLLQYDKQSGGLNEHFPDFLADTLSLGLEHSKYENKSHEMVAQLFADHLVDKNINDDIILKGIGIWNAYCKQTNPTLKNSEPYAAALEYLVQKNFLENTAVTQGQLAKEYGISPGAVSTNFRKLSNAFN